LQGWTLEDPNPDAYGLALQKMAAAAPHTAARRVGEQAAEPLRIVQTAVESGALGFGAWRAVERLVAEHHVSELVDLLAESPDASRPALRADIAPLWTRVTSPDVIRQLASTEPPDFVTLDRVFPHLRVDAFEPLLDVLGAALEDCPPAALPPITQLVHDQTAPSELRVLAIKVLGRVRNTAALNALLALVDGGTNWLGRPKLAARSLELLAALMALAAGWRNDVRAAAVLALAAASKDPDVRSAAIRR